MLPLPYVRMPFRLHLCLFSGWRTCLHVHMSCICHTEMPTSWGNCGISFIHVYEIIEYQYSWDSFTLSIIIKYRKVNLFSRNLVLFIIRYLSVFHIIFILHIITNLLFNFCFAILFMLQLLLNEIACKNSYYNYQTHFKNDYTKARYTMSNFLCASIFFQTFDRISCLKLLVHHRLISNMM